MSRSDTRPWMVVSSSLTTRQPMSRTRSSQTTVDRIVSGDIVAAWWPFALRIASTVMARDVRARHH
jgi:hypothetical protein